MGVRAQVLLCWLQVICAVVFGDVWKVKVESEMETLVSSCVVLPCSFKYPAQQQPSSRIKGMWHMKDKWEDFIYHNDPTRVLDNFKGRTKLIGSLGDLNCSLEIDEVKNHDNGPYCFRVELETSKIDKYSFVDNCVTINLIEQASKPELQAETAVQEGQPTVFKCSIRHTCPSHQPTLSWSHSGKTIMSYKDIGHGNWEAESILTFTPTKEDDHTSITCTVKYHGSVRGEMQATQPIFVKEQATLSHVVIPTISGLGAALLVGLLCFFVVKRYKKRIADLQSRNGGWSQLSRISRRFRSGESSGGPGGREQRRSIWSRFSRRGQGHQIDRNFDNSKAKCYSGDDFDDDYINTTDLNLYGNI
ncbi:sialic acid-binding Ig-like lectin 14 isoform X2 [Ctenopharyngodon idella]|uniref:sialic acid-binding Ig-like lectin 14 isoform X2 n=1 Tax=Ctenopharyngodon idella TaxID=7959 RepID=UPI0022318715|nr:sialic acid-binding Ig-like lectin 14 isoform X2 [Ctenopharyngodon idella]